MTIQPDEIQALVKRTIPNAQAEVEDFTGGGDHFRIVVISSVFQGKTLIDQHRLVQASIHEALEDGRIHAVHIKTFTPEMWAKKRSEGDNLQVL